MSTVFKVAVRNGAKGPGKIQATFNSESDANEAAKLLENNVNGEVIVGPVTMPQPITFAEFKVKIEAEQSKAQARAQALAALTSEQRIALGLEVAESDRDDSDDFNPDSE